MDLVSSIKTSSAMQRDEAAPVVSHISHRTVQSEHFRLKPLGETGYHCV